MKLHAIIRNTVLAATSLMTMLTVTGCHTIFEDSDCDASYNLVKLTYDHNMKFADAFDAEVERVSLLAFDSKTGKLVKRVDADHAQLTKDNELVLQVDPGTYDLLVWGGDYSSHFDIADGEAGTSAPEDFHCYLHRDSKSEVTEEIPNLYHGMVTRVELPYASPSRPHRETVNLKKNTNVVRVVLQHLSGEPVIADDFEFTITDGNGWLNHDNTLRDNTSLTYRPWFTHSGSVDINTNPEDAPTNSPSIPAPKFDMSRSVLGASLAEFTVSRLLMENKPMLTVRNKAENKVVLSVPLNDYALLVKGFGHSNLSDQEYLDRQDEYNMTFFLDQGGRWLNTVVIINDWRIIRHQGAIE